VTAVTLINQDQPKDWDLNIQSQGHSNAEEFEAIGPNLRLRNDAKKRLKIIASFRKNYRVSIAN